MSEPLMPPAFDLSGMRVLVTGAAGGIGAATAEACATMGAAVVLSDVRACDAVADRLRGAGAAVDVVACDVSSRQQVETMAEAVGRVDAAVANAAYCPFDDWMDEGWEESFRAVMDVNVLGPIHLGRAFLPRMGARGGGRMVLVGSVAAHAGGVMAGPHYVASKGGVHSLTRWLARTGAPHNVLVNAVAPGPTATAMIEGQRFDPSRIPLGRLAKPEEVAWPIAFLCSPAASFLCGVILDVNGGLHMA